jgi:hypothetical protein
MGTKRIMLRAQSAFLPSIGGFVRRALSRRGFNEVVIVQAGSLRAQGIAPRCAALLFMGETSHQRAHEH